MTALTVRCTNIRGYMYLTKGKVYDVLNETIMNYSISNDIDAPFLYPQDMFEVVPPIKRRQHADLIIAWAEGATIQYRYMQCAEPTWRDCDKPKWLTGGYEYRVKPANPNADKITALENTLADTIETMNAIKLEIRNLK